MPAPIARSFSLLAVSLAAVSLGGCGGGGGSGMTPTPTPAPANRAPSFTSAATTSVTENSSGTFYTAAASDPDGNSLTFSISGGADAALFQITGVGALSFKTSPDFEAPGDADHNNVYQLTLSVSDGMASATLDLSVTVTNAADGLAVTRVGTGFSQPLFVAPVPDGTGRVFVVEKTGKIRILTPATGAVATTAFLDVSAQIATDSERGLLGLATAPDFATSGIFYVYMTNTAGNEEIRRYHVLAANHDQADSATAEILLTIPHPGQSNHNGGWIAFGPDGLLCIGVGDGGGGGDPNNNAQNTNLLLGKLLRIDVSRDDFPTDTTRNYGIPAGNPFATSGGRPEIWAYGLRNPFRNSFDSATGNLIIADVGQDAVEEVDLMRSSDGGANFGWSQVEGTSQFKGPAPAGSTPPVLQYGHGSGPQQGNSIIGGYVYHGPVVALQGLYIFADYVDGNIWSIPVASFQLGQTLPSSQMTRRNIDFTPNAGTIGNITSFGLDQSGNLYIVDGDGEIFEIRAS